MPEKIFLTFLLFLFSACAQPDYINPEITNQETSKKPSETCDFIFPKSQTCVLAEWKKAPSSTEAGELTIKLEPPPAFHLSALLWMPSMGHGSAPVQVTPIESGTYKITKMYFIMPGDWDVRLFLKNEKNEVVDQVFIQLVVP